MLKKRKKIGLLKNEKKKKINERKEKTIIGREKYIVDE